jgi:hypothetical protein
MAQAKSESQEKSVSDASGSADVEVVLTASAESAYLRFNELAQKALMRGDSTNAHCSTLRQIDDAIENIIPHDYSNPKYALAAPFTGRACSSRPRASTFLAAIGALHMAKESAFNTRRNSKHSSGTWGIAGNSSQLVTSPPCRPVGCG